LCLNFINFRFAYSPPPLGDFQKVFPRRKIFGELSVEYLGSISEENLKGVTREIFVGYFEEDFGENIYHYILVVENNSQTNILK
jgi:hypothetical protein